MLKKLVALLTVFLMTIGVNGLAFSDTQIIGTQSEIPQVPQLSYNGVSVVCNNEYITNGVITAELAVSNNNSKDFNGTLCLEGYQNSNLIEVHSADINLPAYNQGNPNASSAGIRLSFNAGNDIDRFNLKFYNAVNNKSSDIADSSKYISGTSTMLNVILRNSKAKKQPQNTYKPDSGVIVMSKDDKGNILELNGVSKQLDYQSSTEVPFILSNTDKIKSIETIPTGTLDGKIYNRFVISKVGIKYIISGNIENEADGQFFQIIATSKTGKSNAVSLNVLRGQNSNYTMEIDDPDINSIKDISVSAKLQKDISGKIQMLASNTTKNDTGWQEEIYVVSGLIVDKNIGVLSVAYKDNKEVESQLTQLSFKGGSYQLQKVTNKFSSDDFDKITNTIVGIGSSGYKCDKLIVKQQDNGDSLITVSMENNNSVDFDGVLKLDCYNGKTKVAITGGTINLPHNSVSQKQFTVKNLFIASVTPEFKSKRLSENVEYDTNKYFDGSMYHYTGLIICGRADKNVDYAVETKNKVNGQYSDFNRITQALKANTAYTIDLQLKASKQDDINTDYFNLSTAKNNVSVIPLVVRDDNGLITGVTNYLWNLSSKEINNKVVTFGYDKSNKLTAIYLSQANKVTPVSLYTCQLQIKEPNVVSVKSIFDTALAKGPLPYYYFNTADNKLYFNALIHPTDASNTINFYIYKKGASTPTIQNFKFTGTDLATYSNSMDLTDVQKITMDIRDNNNNIITPKWLNIIYQKGK